MKKGTLYLFANSLGHGLDTIVNPRSMSLVTTLEHFVVEEIRSARRLLRAMGYTREFQEIGLYELNEHSKHSNIEELLHPLIQGKDMGLLSEAGLPCIADPGSQLVRLAHQFGIRVVPLNGASSITMALMSSGLNGQNFAFSGYLPRDRSERVKRIKQLEQLCRHQTQLFMDAPYRNDQVMEDLLGQLNGNTLLCVAADITCDTEFIQMKTVNEWKAKVPGLNKRPVMFAIGI